MAQKAGKLASGDFAVKTALKTGKVKLLVVATDAAENTKKELKHLAEMVKVEAVVLVVQLAVLQVPSAFSVVLQHKSNQIFSF